MSILQEISNALVAKRCEKLVKQIGTEVTFSGAKVGISDFTIETGSYSNNYIEFYKVTTLMVTMDNQQYLLCKLIAFENDPELKKTYQQIRLQSIYAFNHLQILLLLPRDQCKDQLDEWVKHMTQLAMTTVELLSPVSKTRTIEFCSMRCEDEDTIKMRAPVRKLKNNIPNYTSILTVLEQTRKYQKISKSDLGKSIKRLNI